MDLIDDFAFPLPMTVIAELLGIPARDRARFRHWSDAFVTPSVNLQRSTKKYLKTRRLMEDFTGYLRTIFAERRQRPRDDLITSLLEAEEQGDRLNEEELFSMMILLIVAGHETAVNLIGNGVLALLQHPAQMEQLHSQPALLALAVEEILRYEGPVERATMRFAATEVEVGGQTIRRGDAVSLVLAAADRDPAHFDQPDGFDITRTPNRHLGFGLGIHYCLGAPLARLEGQIALATLRARLPQPRLATPVESLRWRTVPILRGMPHLPLVW
jgi:cytochrome P450